MPELMNVERVANLSPSVFWRRYVRPQKPVIVTDLVRDQPLAALSTAAAARRAVGEMSFLVSWNYVASLRYRIDQSKIEPESCSLGDYLDYVDLNPDTPKMCIEQRVTPELESLYAVPALCRKLDRTLMFIGNAGNFAPLHFDGDNRQVLMTQMFGRKRVVLVPPWSAPKLLPHENFSSICLQNLRPEDQRDFLRYVGGYDCEVRPGESLFMPMLWWHYVEYRETSLSLHFRFGRNRYGEFFDTHIHRSVHAQNVAYRYVNEHFGEGLGKEGFERLERVVKARHKSARHKYRAIEGLLGELCQEFSPHWQREPYAIREWSPSPEDTGTDFYEAMSRRRRPRVQGAEGAPG